jgi:hypothetical protein
MMMKGILADHNVEGHLEVLLRIWQGTEWREIWESLNLTVKTFPALGLAVDTPDTLVWQACQSQQIVLITANRNDEGPDSLERAIRLFSGPHCLPVFTLADADRVLNDKRYAGRAAVTLLQYFLTIDSCCGAGRLYVP